MPYYFYHESPIWNFNAIFYWKLDQPPLGGITVEKLKNPLWEIFSYLDTRVPTPNKQPFLHFIILPPYFCSDFSLITFSYIFLYCSYSDIIIFDDILNFDFIYFCKVITSRYWSTTLYPLCYYIKQSP